VRCCAQFAGGQLERLPAATQGRQHIELVPLQPVLDECGRAPIRQHIGEAGDAGQDMHRLDIEVRAFPAPGIDDFVHLVAHASIIGIILISRFSPRDDAPRTDTPCGIPSSTPVLPGSAVDHSLSC